MNILYFDCGAGISGDMTVAALLELGVPLELLQGELARLPLPHSSYSLDVERVKRQGIMATRFHVHVGEHQPHRHYTDIAGMIESSSLAAGIKERAQRVFYRLAEAEARVHGVELGHVHFHEVGAVDSIVDIVGTAIGLDFLGVTEIHASSLPLGSGWVETAHGRLPVPAPATAELLKGMPVHGESGPGERVTPTGAAILAALATGFGTAPSMRLLNVGCGAGSREFPDVPNILRLVLGEKDDTLQQDDVMVAETHIDDMNPEILGFLMERLLEKGALDVSFSPLQMKKNRPGIKLTILSSPTHLDELARLVLTETTSAGIRYYPARRLKLERAEEERATSLGPVRVKVFRDAAGMLRVAPEFEECRRLAIALRLPLLKVYQIIERETAEP
jgi:pyridinium-3,5-bisthiocarboxylic acid mononucleotide nickel chelatase